MSKYAKITITILLSLLGFSAFIPSQIAAADDTICDNPNVPNATKASLGCPGTGTADKLPNVAINIINGILAALGIVAVIFVLYGGISLITSTGDPGKVKKAKDTILYALIGLIICVLSYAIVNFVILDIIA